MAKIYTEADLRAAFGRADRRVRTAVATGIERLLEFTASKARRNVRLKRKTARALGAGATLINSIGKGAAGIQYIKKTPVVVFGGVGTKLPYGVYLEFGTGIYGPKKQVIRPKRAKVLAWPTVTGFEMAPGISATGKPTRHRRRTMKMTFRRWVRGTPAWHWLSEAHTEMKSTTISVMANALREAGI